jgi:hypothetical protein
VDAGEHHDSDPTVRLRAPGTRSGTGRAEAGRFRGWLVAGGVAVVAAVGGAAAFGLIGTRPAPAPIKAPAPAAAPSPAPAPGPSAALPAIAVATEADILAWRGSTTALFRFAANPRVLVLVFPNLHAQADMLLRVAALVEVRDMPRDRVLDGAALATAIRARGGEPDRFYYGHDYRAADLARFFNLAARAAVPLAPDEETLHALAGEQGWLAPGARGALLSIPMEDVAGDPAGRAVILRHELSHGEYFTDPDYAAFARLFWATALTEGERERFRAFLARQEYDVSDEDLMINETQAYLEHTRDPAFFRAEAVGITEDRLAELRARFRAGMPPGWLRDATPP